MIHIAPFLKTLISFILSEHRNKDPLDEEILDESNTLFVQMLEDAVAFCNEDEAKPNERHARFMKDFRS